MQFMLYFTNRIVIKKYINTSSCSYSLMNNWNVLSMDTIKGPTFLERSEFRNNLYLV